jgi:hypothetical protein
LLSGIEAARWKPFFTKDWFLQSSDLLKWTTLKQPLAEGSKRGGTEIAGLPFLTFIFVNCWPVTWAGRIG